MLFGIILTITILLSGRVENVRLCGKQLADLLNNICERNGGFHTPTQGKILNYFLTELIAICRFIIIAFITLKFPLIINMAEANCTCFSWQFSSIF